MEKIHFRMTSEKKVINRNHVKTEKRAYLVKLENDNGKGWFTYTIWDRANKIWIKPSSNMPSLIHERLYDVIKDVKFSVRSLDFTNELDFGWINEHNIIYPFFEIKE